MPILRLHLITKLMFIRPHIYPYDIPGKTHKPTNHILNNNIYIYIFAHCKGRNKVKMYTWVFFISMTAYLNAAHHGWLVKKIFNSR